MEPTTSDHLFDGLVMKYFEKSLEVAARYKRLREQAQKVFNRNNSFPESIETLWKYINLIENGLIDYAEQYEAYESGLYSLLETWDNNSGNKEMSEASNKFILEELMKQREIADHTQMGIVQTIGTLRQIILLGAKTNNLEK
jgi:hypothetical protein